MQFFENLLNVLSENSITDYIIAAWIFFSFTILAPMLSTTLIKLFHIKEKKTFKN